MSSEMHTVVAVGLMFASYMYGLMSSQAKHKAEGAVLMVNALIQQGHLIIEEDDDEE